MKILKLHGNNSQKSKAKHFTVFQEEFPEFLQILEIIHLQNSPRKHFSNYPGNTNWFHWKVFSKFRKRNSENSAAEIVSYEKIFESSKRPGRKFPNS